MKVVQPKVKRQRLVVDKSDEVLARNAGMFTKAFRY